MGYSILIVFIVGIVFYFLIIPAITSNSKNSKKESLHYIDFSDKSLSDEKYDKQKEVKDIQHSNTDNGPTSNEDIYIVEKSHANYTTDVLIGKSVFHDSFGEGKITKIENDKYICVFFFDSDSDKKFLFPDAFAKHLKIHDELSNEIVQHFFAKKNQIEKVSTQHSIQKKKALVITAPTKKLLEDHVYSIGSPTNSKNVYAYGCKYFDWETSQMSNFGQLGALLYAKNATHEGYSVWCICHSNLNPTTTKLKWSNKILGDYIYETWHATDEGLWSDKTTRVVFVLQKGSYRFRGIHEFLEIKQNEKMEYVKIYKRISTKYPN